MKASLIAYLMSCLILLSSFEILKIDKASFYEAFSSGEEAAIDKKLVQLESEKSTSQNNAYIGALTMKKAGFVKGVKGKVSTFKKGAHLLEEEIRQNPGNAEFRFLRLAVQEHAPSILKYNKQIDEDKQAVVASFAKLDEEVKAIVVNYAKDSKVLKSAELK